jgi:hypothetical protein
MLMEMPRKRKKVTASIPGGAKRTRRGCTRAAAIAKGKSMLMPAVNTAAARWSWSCLRSTSVPIRNMKRISPIVLRVSNGRSDVCGKRFMKTSGKKRPRREGPSKTPPVISPITRAWPTLLASQPHARVTRRITAVCTRKSVMNACNTDKRARALSRTTYLNGSASTTADKRKS